MSELSPEGGSEGYGASSDEAAAPAWSSWRVKNCPALPAYWTPDAERGGCVPSLDTLRFSAQNFAQQ